MVDGREEVDGSEWVLGRWQIGRWWGEVDGREWVEVFSLRLCHDGGQLAAVNLHICLVM